MENGSWAPAAARLMRAELEKMKELRLCETDVSLRGALNQTSEAQMDALVAELCAELAASLASSVRPMPQKQNIVAKLFRQQYGVE